MHKNEATKWLVYAWTHTTGAPKTGDAAQITATIYIDGASNAVDDTNPTELAQGFYLFDITAAETNGDHICIVAESSTGNVAVKGMPDAVWTETDDTLIAAVQATVDAIEAAVITNAAGTDIAADIIAVKADTAAILADTGTDGVIQAAADKAALVDLIWDEPGSGHVTAGTLGEAMGTREGGLVVADGANSISVFKHDLASTVDAYCVGSYVKFTSGNVINQVRKILGYSGATKFIQVSTAFTAVPATGASFIIINQ